MTANCNKVPDLHHVTMITQRRGIFSRILIILFFNIRDCEFVDNNTYAMKYACIIAFLQLVYTQGIGMKVKN